jgi:Uma2 family endonuclease
MVTTASAGGVIVCDAKRSNLAAETDTMHMAQITDEWTLEQLHRLPEDGNKYELVRGELFVTPPPSVAHEELAAALGRILDHYAEEHGLGRVHRPRAVLRTLASEVEPDLMVRAKAATDSDWAALPIPLLVVEIVSATTRRRDYIQKRDLYVDAGVPEYWIVDGRDMTVRIVRPGREDVLASQTFSWNPIGATEQLTIDVAALFSSVFR